MGPWQHIIETMLAGQYVQTGFYRPWMLVDVRDAAACHIGLLESVLVKNGERYLAASGDKRTVEDICADIDRLLPELRFEGATAADPFPENIQVRQAEFRAIWTGMELRNDRIRAATGLSLRPTDDSVRDCVESLVSIAAVKVARRVP